MQFAAGKKKIVRPRFFLSVNPKLGVNFAVCSEQVCIVAAPSPAGPGKGRRPVP